ncbi:MAG: hypothetical protein ACD_9C00338G0005, partial [uncultured bacterium]
MKKIFQKSILTLIVVLVGLSFS